MDSFSLNNVFNITAKIIFGSVIALPLSLSNYSLSHQKGMSLNYSKTAPPLAVFDDEKIPVFIDDFEVALKNEHKSAQKNIQKLKATKLLRQRRHAAIVANKISKEFARLQSKSITPKIQVRTLAGLSIKKKSQEVAVLAKTDSKSTYQVNYIPVAQKSYVEQKKFIETLRPSLRARVEEVENFDEILAQNFTVETFEERAQKVLSSSGIILSKTANDDVKNNKPATRKTYAQRTFPTKSPMPSGSSLSKSNGGKDRANRFARSGYARNGLKPDPKPTPKSDPIEVAKDFMHEDSGDKSTEKGVVAAAAVQPIGSHLTQAMISGPIEISGGLAFTNNNQHILVYRQIAGTKYEFGQVVIQEGRYEIYIEDPTSGIIVAELTDNGDMIGRAEISIPEVILHSKNKEKFENIPIKIKPVVDKVVVSTVSEYNVFTKQKMKAANILIADALEGDQEFLNSTIVMKATSEGYWGNLSVGSTKNPFLNILSPESTVKALLDILGVALPKELMGIIRGEVKIAGKKVSGAQVELAGNTITSPIYFNSFIPDRGLSATSENGEFAFVGLAPGSYLIRAKYKNKYLSPLLVPVENGFITRANFEVREPSLSEAFVFDIQTSEMMSANLGFLGSEQKTPVHSRKLISFSGSEGVQFLEAQAFDQNFYSTRVTVDKSEKEILIPMVSHGWLSNLLTRLKVSVIPDTGMIIGTAPNLPYAVELDPKGYNSNTQIIYFDQRGQPVPGAMVTPSGGGFVIINANNGFRSLVTRYYGTRNIKITTLAVDGSAINLFPSKL